MALISACLDHPDPNLSLSAHTVALEYLRPLIHEIITSCSAFLCALLSSSTTDSIATLSPFVPHSLFKAGCIVAADTCNDGEEWCRNALEILRRALGKMGERWDTGSK